MNKIKEFFKSLVARFKALFKRSKDEVATPVPATPVQTIIEPVKPRPERIFDFTPYKDWHIVDVYRVRQQQGFSVEMTPAEWVRAKAAGVIIPADKAPVEAVDRSGFALSSNGDPKVNPVSANEYVSFVFTATKKKQKFSVMGAPGAFFHNATAYIPNGMPTKEQGAFGVGTEFDVELPAGQYQFIVKVDAAGQLAVQYTESEW